MLSAATEPPMEEMTPAKAEPDAESRSAPAERGDIYDTDPTSF
jgi:hypothetical protein